MTQRVLSAAILGGRQASQRAAALATQAEDLWIDCKVEEAAPDPIRYRDEAGRSLKAAMK